MKGLIALVFAIVMCKGEIRPSSSREGGRKCLCELSTLILERFSENVTQCKNLSSSACYPSLSRIKKVYISDEDTGSYIEVLEHLACGCSPPLVHQKRRYARSASSSLSEKSTPAPARSARSKKTMNLSLPPNIGNLSSYQTCLACKAQMDFCQDDGKVFDSDVCHCVFPASRTFLNSFYTLGVVMLTIMVCCFLVFGVQKGDENVLSSNRRLSSSNPHRRRLGSYRLDGVSERSERIIRPSMPQTRFEPRANSIQSTTVVASKNDLLSIDKS